MRTCRICLNDRPNEKFSGYGMKISVCKKCIKRPDRDLLLEKMRISDMVNDGRKISEKTKKNLRKISRSHENEVIRTHAAVTLYTAEIDTYVRYINKDFYHHYGDNLKELETLKYEVKTFYDAVMNMRKIKYLSEDMLLFYICHRNKIIAHLAYKTFEYLEDIEVNETYEYVYGRTYDSSKNDREFGRF